MRYSFRRRRSLSLGLMEIGMKLSLSSVMVAGTYLLVTVNEVLNRMDEDRGQEPDE